MVMEVERIRIGDNPDGSPHFLIRAVDENGVVVPDAHIVLTGPIQGEVVTSSGEKIDVTPFAVAVDTAAEALAISDAIGAQHAAEGHPDHDADQPFVHTPSELSHSPDGTPAESYAQALEELAPADQRYDGPQTVIDHLTSKGGGGDG